MGVGIYNRDYLTRFKNVSIAVRLEAATDPDRAPLIAGKPGYTIVITKITFHVTTAAAQAITFRDNNGTPKIAAVLPASAAVGDTHLLLDAPDGFPLTEGKQLDVDGAAGVAGSYYVEAFLKPTGVLTPDQV